MNILVFAPTFLPCRKSGIDKVVYEFYKLDKLNSNTVYIITLNCDIESESKYSNVIYLPNNKIKVQDILLEDYTKYFNLILKSIKNIKEFDFIINHDWFLSDLAYKINLFLKKPLISFVHSVKYEEYKGLLSKYQKKIHEKQLRMITNSNKIICLSNNVKKSIINLTNVPINIDIIRCGMDYPSPINLKKNKIFTYYYHGRFAKEKNILNLLKAFSKINFESRLILRGEGKFKNLIFEYINKHQLSNSVTIIDWTSDSEVIKKDLLNIHVYVLPSYYEPFGLSILEAISMCVPSIIPNNYGGLEIYSQLKTGCLHNPLSINSLYEAMVYSFENYSLLEEKLEKNRWQCYDYYNWEIGYSQLSNILKQELNKCFII